MDNRVTLNSEEQALFADYMYAFRESQPEASIGAAIKFTRAQFPPDRRISENVSGLTQLAWMKPALDAAERRAKAKKRKEEAEKRANLDARAKVALPEPKSDDSTKVRKTSKTKVRLNDEERRTFAEAVYLIRRNKPGIGWEMIMAEANESLPLHRRIKNYASPSQVHWLPELLNEVDAAHRKQAEELARHEAQIAAAPQAAQPTTIEDAIAQMLLPGLVQRIGAQLGQALNTDQFKASMASALQGAVQAPTEKQVARKKVLIVGLLPAQGEEIKKQWSKHFDLRIFDSKVTSDRVRDNLKGMDYVLVMTRFVSHSTVAVMRGHHGFRFCNGTVVALDTLLLELSQKIQKERAGIK